MTEIRVRAARPNGGADALGVAAACLGLFLLAGTTLSSLTQAGPAFPTNAATLPVSLSDEEERSVGVASAQTTPARSQMPGETGSEPREPLPPQGIDINAADVATLQSLPGVGRSLAQRIVAHRETQGPFRKAADLLQVAGIGAKRYARLQGLIRTQEAP